MTVGASLVFLALVAPHGSLAQSQERAIGTRASSDQTITVPKGTRVEIDDCAGELVVRTWERDAVRIQSRHTSRTRVEADLRGSVLSVEIDGDRGPAIADLDLTVPAWIGLQIDGRNCAPEIEGVSGAIGVETVEGDVILRGVSGSVDAKSIDGTITLEASRGRAQLSTVDGTISLVKTGGEVIADSVNGDISVVGGDATALELSTVDGDITFSGIFQPSGRYLFTTHDGNVELAIPDTSSATFTVRTFGDGRVDSALPLKQVTAGRRGQRSTFTLGAGAAPVDIEVFDGTVRIRRP